MRIFREELFGPAVGGDARRTDADDAPARSPTTATTASAPASSRGTSTVALRYAREIEAGVVYINAAPPWRADLMPYGGVKQQRRRDRGAALRGPGNDGGEDRCLPAALTRRGPTARAAADGRRATRLTVAQALVRYLQVQHSRRDGEEQRLIPAIFGIFGHGNVAGLSQALVEYGDELPYYQPCNEQSMVHTAAGFAKAMQPPRDARLHARRSARARRTWSPARRWRRSTACRCCCCPPTTTRPAGRARCCSSSSTRSRST